MTEDRTTRNMTLRLVDVPMTEAIIKGKTFVGCTIQGPGLLAPLKNVTIADCIFRDDLDAMLWEVALDRAAVGVIGAEDCEFRNCTFAGVGLVGTAEFLAQIRADINRSGAIASSTGDVRHKPVKIGTDLLFGVPFPVVIDDRWFHAYRRPDETLGLDVFRWDVEGQEAIYEVIENSPIGDRALSNATGSVSFLSEAGGFEFRFRPEEKRSQFFGTKTASGYLVKFRDNYTSVERDGVEVARFAQNSLTNALIGLQIDGEAIRYGVNRLPEGMRLVERT